jgi:hypothetical protein
MVAQAFGMSTNTPPGYSLHLFPMGSQQWIEIARAYTNDKAEYDSMSISEIYAIATGTFTGSKLVSKKVNAWIGTVFFILQISTGCNSTTAVLFTPASSTKPALNVSTDYSSLLVMVIPESATVRISSRPVDATFYDDAAESWSKQNTTRADILWLSHDRRNPHASQASTLSTAKHMAWWPGIETDVRKYLKWCMICCLHLRDGVVC